VAAIIDVTDPRGHRVVCSGARWEQHICRTHPELVAHLAEVERTLQEPHFIAQDVEDPCSQAYYSFRLLPGQMQNCYLKVIVRFDDRWRRKRGYVVTAYPVTVVTKEERVIWISPDLPLFPR